jgi:hypothetical protein
MINKYRYYLSFAFTQNFTEILGAILNGNNVQDYQLTNCGLGHTKCTERWNEYTRGKKISLVTFLMPYDVFKSHWFLNILLIFLIFFIFYDMLTYPFHIKKPIEKDKLFIDCLVNGILFNVGMYPLFYQVISYHCIVKQWWLYIIYFLFIIISITISACYISVVKHIWIIPLYSIWLGLNIILYILPIILLSKVLNNFNLWDGSSINDIIYNSRGLTVRYNIYNHIDSCRDAIDSYIHMIESTRGSGWDYDRYRTDLLKIWLNQDASYLKKVELYRTVVSTNRPLTLSEIIYKKLCARRS